ncbi:MAG: HDIG domain-containing protein [Planctomycetota bacterium]|nr:HDIG domain-containing protein [Planctomycetota bacterium]
MDAHVPTRAEALALLHEFNSSEALRRHALAVEAVMRHIARQRGEDEEKWGVVGLTHDLDYEKFPDQHCKKTAEIMRERGWPEEYVRAAISHGWGVCCDCEPQTLLEKTLYAIDELTGLVGATALVRPSKSLLDLEAKSVMKKFKDKAFAASVSRAVIQKGADSLGVQLPALVNDVIMGMRPIAAELGLKGTL